MIRLANRHDIPKIAPMLIEFMRESTYRDHIEDPDPQYLHRLIFNVIYAGYIWLWIDSESEEETIAGLLAAVKEPNIWMPRRYQLRELVWYVRPEYRGNPMSGRLFIEFCRQGDELMESGNIVGYATTRMDTTTNYNLERRGFRLTEQTYVKD